jgi:hypothetical protein
MNFIELVNIFIFQIINSILFAFFLKLQSFLKQRLNEYHVNENGKKNDIKKNIYIFHLRFKNFLEKC